MNKMEMYISYIYINKYIYNVSYYKTSCALLAFRTVTEPWSVRNASFFVYNNIKI